MAQKDTYPTWGGYTDDQLHCQGRGQAIGGAGDKGIPFYTPITPIPAPFSQSRASPCAPLYGPPVHSAPAATRSTVRVGWSKFVQNRGPESVKVALLYRGPVSTDGRNPTAQSAFISLHLALAVPDFESGNLS